MQPLLRLPDHSPAAAHPDLGIADGDSNYIRVFMVSIRRKLEPDPAHPRAPGQDAALERRSSWWGTHTAAPYLSYQN
jgi:hypothetical protein